MTGWKILVAGLGVWVWLALQSPATAATSTGATPESESSRIEAAKRAPQKSPQESDEQAGKKKKKKKKRKGKKFPAPYRESLIVYRNVVSARSFDKNADLTYNPYYAMEFKLSPTFWAGPYTYLNLDVTFSKELTEPDSGHSRETTKEGEVILADIYLEVGVPELLKIPKAEIDFSPAVRFYVPSSKVSKARTLILGIRPGFSLTKRFDVFRGLSLSYRFWARKSFHESTTAVNETPLVSVPVGSSRSSESLTHTGVRNASFGISNGLELRLAIMKYLGISAGVSLVHAFLYQLRYEDDRISYEPQSPTDVRYKVFYTGEIYARPLKALIVALGFETENFQLTEGSSYEKPFFNRYTAIFLDIRLYLAALASNIKSKRGRK